MRLFADSLVSSKEPTGVACIRPEPPMPLLPARHNFLFRLLGADPGRVAALVTDSVPPELTERLDPDHPPEYIEVTDIDGDGWATQADAVFRMRMKDGTSPLIHVLIEDKAKPDARSSLQSMRFILQLWMAKSECGERPHGRRSLVVNNLSDTAPDNLASRADVAGVLLALAKASAKEISDAEADAMAKSIGYSELGLYMLTYVTALLSLSPERLEAALRRVGNDPETVEALMKTAAQVWLEEGEAKGEARGMAAGIAQGKSETLARQLKCRFGPLPDKVQAHIAAANLDQIDRWLEAVLDAPTLDAVFGGASEHR